MGATLTAARPHGQCTIEPRDVMTATDTWRAAFPGAVAGALAMHDVMNPERSEALEARKRALEDELRSGPAPEATLRAYADHYRAHGKTYHLKAQWESVARKGKPIPSRAALVEAMFMAELENLLLTAGHDLEAIAAPVAVDVTRDGDRYVLMSGAERDLGPGDMKMADREGIVSSVLHGPDRRTRIGAGTRSVLFAVYAPAGVAEADVRGHLESIRANVLLLAPEAETELLTTIAAA
jgi:DNA/RNA-binding domain of Phe-tRNA-synthetase-like protein